MNNGSCIIDAIIGEANAAADANIAAATARANEITSSAKIKAAADTAALQDRRQAITAEIVGRKAMVANIDAKKLKLNTKMEIIDEVFDDAPQSIKKDKRYAEFLKKLITVNAENGDTVIISKTDAAMADKAFQESIGKLNGIKLNFSKEYGEFDGGVIISNANYDKNLTLESIVKQMRNETEMEIAEVLFGK